MKKNYNTRKLKAKQSYSTQELAEKLKVHAQTVRDWRKRGLVPIDKSSHLALYLGSDVRSYLKEQSESRKVKLLPSEFYCLGCQAKTTSDKTIIVSQNKFIGNGKVSVRREGVCVKCGNKLARFASLQPNEPITGEVINTGLSPAL